VLATDPATPLVPGGESPETPAWWTPPHAVAVGLAGAAAVGLGLGLYFDARAQASASDANGMRGSLTGACTGPLLPLQCAALRDQIGAVHEDDVLKNVSFALGAAAGVGAAIGLVVAGPGAQAPIGSARWAPTVGPAPERGGLLRAGHARVRRLERRRECRRRRGGRRLRSEPDAARQPVRHR
jgi:hypothetical protein